MNKFISKGLGLKRDLPDIRDFTFEPPFFLKAPRALPAVVDLRGHTDMPPIYDQGQLGSCTAQAVASLCDFETGAVSDYWPSTLFLYYVTRSTEGTVDADSGATIRDTIKAANEFGISTEGMWPYIVDKFNLTPPKSVFDVAEMHQALTYRRVKQTLQGLKECLADENLIAFGIGVYEGLYKIDAENPELELPDYSQELQGGHAIVIVGYDDERQRFIVRNSWGRDFGIQGYFYIPYSYVLNTQLSFDFWTISLVEK